MRRQVPPGGVPAAADDTSGLMAYVGSRTSRHRDGRGTGLEVYRVEAGRWHHEQTVTLPNPTYLTRGPGQVLYAAHGDSTTVRVLRIAPASGHLELVEEVDAGGVNPVHLALSPHRRHLLVANHNSGTVASLPVAADGGLARPVSVLELAGELGPHRRDQSGSKPHQVVVDPSASFVLVPDKGLDSIFVLEVDQDGTLSMDPGRTVRLREMSGPRHLAFHPDGAAAYSVEEFRSTLTRYDWDGRRGRLSPRQVVSCLPEHMVTDSRAAEIVVDRTGRRVYASNRGGPGDHTPGGFTADTVVCFDLDGHGLARPTWSETLGTRPRFFTPTPDGSGLVVAHERGHSIAEHPIDPVSGQLGPPVLRAQTGSPVCVLLEPIST